MVGEEENGGGEGVFQAGWFLGEVESGEWRVGSGGGVTRSDDGYFGGVGFVLVILGLIGIGNGVRCGDEKTVFAGIDGCGGESLADGVSDGWWDGGADGGWAVHAGDRFFGGASV
jgi:hypothetical protein